MLHIFIGTKSWIKGRFAQIPFLKTPKHKLIFILAFFLSTMSHVTMYFEIAVIKSLSFVQICHKKGTTSNNYRHIASLGTITTNTCFIVHPSTDTPPLVQKVTFS